jgi:YidC/Oxa1 family membrane protein insertase
MIHPNPFNQILVWPILNILIGIYHLLSYIHLPFALGFSIILLTVLIRIVVYPFTASQLRTSQKMQKITPHINKLKEKHKNDAKMLQAETMRLYKEHGVNPAAGCLPAIIQLPIIWGLYAVLQYVVGTAPKTLITEINKLVYFPSLKLTSVIDTNFFGLPLGTSPSKLLTTVGVLILLFPIVTAVLQFLQSKMMFTPAPVEEVSKKDKKIKEVKEEKKSDDFASAMQTQSMYIFPIMIGFFSWTLPLGLSLYWNTFTIFGIIQQYEVTRSWGGLLPWINKPAAKIFDVLGVTTGIEMVDTGENVELLLQTEENGMLIGYHGETLEALQLVISLAVAKALGKFVRVSLEIGEYKKNRMEYLNTLVAQTKDQVIAENTGITLPSLKSWERRYVHMILQDDDQVATESSGEGRDRVLTIYPKQ